MKTNSDIRNVHQLRVVFMFLLAVFVIASCKDKKNITQGEKAIIPASPAPDWVNARPHNGAFYIGVGSSSKTSQPLDYQNVAKKNALNDLASEISVRVQGQTFLNSLEVNKNFSEEFISTISTTTDEKIENFEVVGIWENDKEYWTYYRLSKSEYLRQKSEKKNKALSAANDFYLKGRAAESVANIPVAFDMYMRGLFAMKAYWNDVNEYLSDTGMIYLDNEIFSSLQRIGTGLSIKSDRPKITLSAANAYQVNVPVKIEYEGKAAKGITLAWSYLRAEYFKPRNGLTDDSGRLVVDVSNVSTVDKNNNLALSINIEPLLVSDLDRTIQTGLIKNMRPDQKQIPIELITPSFFIKSDEYSFDKPASGRVLSSAMSGELVKQGMRIASSSKDTNYIVSIKSNTTDGGTTQGFNVAHLDMQISVSNTITGELMYEESFTSIKGLQLNTTAAATEAYKKAKEKIEKEVVKSILENIL